MLICTVDLTPASAETISAALASAYTTNPDLNQQRAGARAVDETVSKAKAGFRPQAFGNGSVGYQYSDSSNVVFNTLSGNGSLNGSSLQETAGLTVSQNLFNGNRTRNQVEQATTQVFSAREQIRNTEQNTLQNGATAYMNVLRDLAVLELNKNNIVVLSEQLRETRLRYRFGEVTNTDVAQADSALSTGRSDYFTARSNLQTSMANYRKVIGRAPVRLEPARPVDALLPASLDDAVAVANGEHPLIVGALHDADAAQLQIQINEGLLYPTLDAVGSIQETDQQADGNQIRSRFSSVVGQISVPIYTGGDVYALVRQAKELQTQARLKAELQRTSVRAGVVTAWGQLRAAKATVSSARVAVKAAEVALAGVRDEAKVGQRTTLDILIAQQTLLSSRISLVSAQRDWVVASYAVLAAVGRLSAGELGLSVSPYDPTIHFEQVKDKWAGLRTPDGR